MRKFLPIFAALIAIAVSGCGDKKADQTPPPYKATVSKIDSAPTVKPIAPIKVTDTMVANALNATLALPANAAVAKAPRRLKERTPIVLAGIGKNYDGKTVYLLDARKDRVPQNDAPWHVVRRMLEEKAANEAARATQDLQLAVNKPYEQAKEIDRNYRELQRLYEDLRVENRTSYTNGRADGYGAAWKHLLWGFAALLVLVFGACMLIGLKRRRDAESNRVDPASPSYPQAPSPSGPIGSTLNGDAV